MYTQQVAKPSKTPSGLSELKPEPYPAGCSAPKLPQH